MYGLTSTDPTRVITISMLLLSSSSIVFGVFKLLMFYDIFWILGFDEVFFAVVFSYSLLCKVLFITITNFM